MIHLMSGSTGGAGLLYCKLRAIIVGEPAPCILKE